MSRKRQKNRSGRGGAQARREALNELYGQMFASLEPALAEPDPFEVEFLLSSFLGAVWTDAPPGTTSAARDTDLPLGLVAYAARRDTPESLALLRGIEALGVTEVLRTAAGEAAAALVARGVPQPPWAGAIGRVEVGECWMLRDVYGDQASMLCVFAYGSKRHVLLTLLDYDVRGGWIKDVFCTDSIDEALQSLRDEAAQPMAVLEEIDPGRARLLLEAGLRGTDALKDDGALDDAYDEPGSPDEPETLPEMRALAAARIRALPATAEAEPEPELDAAALERLATEFLASPEAADLPAGPAERRCAEYIVVFSAEVDPDPLRISPGKVEYFMHGWLPAAADDLDDDVIDALPAVILAWSKFAGRRAGLSPEAMEPLLAVAEECGGHFAEALSEGAEEPGHDDPEHVIDGEVVGGGVIGGDGDGPPVRYWFPEVKKGSLT